MPYNPILCRGTDYKGNPMELMDNLDGTFTDLYHERVITDEPTCRVYRRWFSERDEHCIHPKIKREVLEYTQEGQVGFGADGVITSETVDHFERCGNCHTITQEHVLTHEEE